MKVISSGNTYEVFDDSLRTYERFPVQSYVVRFSKFKGFYLEKYSDPKVNESKIYGVHTEKVNKVLNAFEKFNRNLGVILSGDKGIGKSLFARLLGIKAAEKGIPLIVVDTYVPGIASYIESIDQEVMVLFDEFDKTFGDVKASDGEASPQANLLSLFDGVSSGKKLFVITCNEINKLNEYFINRPGRFHYHFRFEYPSDVEIREYLTDKLHPDYHSEIDEVIKFSKRINLNFDCLRAIAFEINNGESFKEAIKDLNVINSGSYQKFDIILHYNNGMTANVKGCGMDLFSDGRVGSWLSDREHRDYIYVCFDTSDVQYDATTMRQIVPSDYLDISFDDDDDNEERVEFINKIKNIPVKFVELKLAQKRNIHYAL